MSKKWLNGLLFLLSIVWFVAAMYKRDGLYPILSWVTPVLFIALLLLKEYVFNKNKETYESPNHP